MFSPQVPKCIFRPKCFFRAKCFFLNTFNILTVHMRHVRSLLPAALRFCGRVERKRRVRRGAVARLRDTYTLGTERYKEGLHALNDYMARLRAGNMKHARS